MMRHSSIGHDAMAAGGLKAQRAIRRDMKLRVIAILPDAPDWG